MAAGAVASGVSTPVEVSMVRMYNDGAATTTTTAVGDDGRRGGGKEAGRKQAQKPHQQQRHQRQQQYHQSGQNANAANSGRVMMMGKEASNSTATATGSGSASGSGSGSGSATKPNASPSPSPSPSPSKPTTATTTQPQRNYRHVGDALLRIGREEGIGGLWRGATPTIFRSMVVNCVQLGVYDIAKERMMAMTKANDGVAVQLGASATSGFCYSVVTLPIDSAKTRMQIQHVSHDGKLPYRNIVQATVKIAAEEGLLALWRGFMPYFSRCAGHTVAMFLVLEQVKKISSKLN